MSRFFVPPPSVPRQALNADGVPFAPGGGYALWIAGGPEPSHDVDLGVAEGRQTDHVGVGMTYAVLPEDKASLAGGLVIGVAGLGNATVR